jgi:putative ABC transport system permease protein
VNWLSQIVAVTLLNIRTLPQRKGTAVVAAVGIAGVVAVFVAVLSLAEGFRQTMTMTGSRDVAIVMRAGTDSEMSSILMLEDVRIVTDAPGVLRGTEGPVASAELFVIVDLPKRTTGTDANVPLRGVQQAAFAVRPDVRIVEGRAFRPGRNEVIVGSAAAAQFRGLEVGSVLRWGEQDWVVAGVFDAGGTVSDSEIWCDVAVLQPAYRRGTSFQSVYTRLASEADFDGFKDALTTDPRLNVKVLRETEFYAEQATMLYAVVTQLGLVVAVLMGIGAVFGALNTMYSAVSARMREIATLRAMGFGGFPVVVSVLVESMLLALIGGLAGGVIAYAAFNGYQTATMNWQSFSQVAFRFAVTPELLVQGVVYSLLMGFAGGVLPAFRAARLPVVTALREL